MIKLINLQRDTFLDNWEGVKKDNIHPEHYKGKVQPIDLIDAQNLNFNLGNVVKYCCRSGKKGSALEDLTKAMYYLQREINKFEVKNEK